MRTDLQYSVSNNGKIILKVLEAELMKCKWLHLQD